MGSKRQEFIQILAKLGKAHFQGRAGSVTRKPVNASAVGQSQITTPRHVEDKAYEHGRGKKYPDPHDPREPKDSIFFYYPDIYTNGRKCSQCKRFRKPSEFSPQRRRGKVYLQSICKFCRAENAYRQYHGLLENAP